MSADPRDLQWGETPFDRMTPDDVLLNAKRMYSTLSALWSVARQMALAGGPYWEHGVGGAAIEKGRQAFEAIDGEYEGREPAYRTFYRYADDLLFETDKHPMIGHDWRVCDRDGMMSGGRLGDSHRRGCFKCGKPMRPITWADLAPQPDQAPADDAPRGQEEAQ